MFIAFGAVAYYLLTGNHDAILRKSELEDFVVNGKVPDLRENMRISI